MVKRNRRVSAKIAAAIAVTLAMTVSKSARAAEAQGTFSNGLKFSSADGQLEFQAIGRLHVDYGVFDGDDEVGSLDDGVELRRLRAGFAGKLYGNVEFKLLVEFAASQVAYTDVYMGLKTRPFLIRVGQFYQPFGLDTQTSDNYLSFVEHSMPAALSPNRQIGLVLMHELGEARGTLSASVYQEDSGDGVNEDHGYWSSAARATFLPLGAPGDATLLHLGVAYANRRNGTKEFRVVLSPEAHLAPRFADLQLPAESWNQVGLELALVRGAWSAMADGAYVDSAAPTGLEDGTLYSYSAELSWFLTGEGRTYRASTGLFDRVKPAHNYDGKGGRGALEFALRYSATATEDGAAAAGRAHGLTLGANWYLNPQSRLMLDYLYSEGTDTPDLAGVVQGLVTRFQVDF